MESTQADAIPAAPAPSIINVICGDAVHRFQKVLRVAGLPFALAFSAPQHVSGAPVLSQAAQLTPYDPTNTTQVQNDVESLITQFNYATWRSQVKHIRDTDSLEVCLTRLSEAMVSIGTLQSFSAGGTAGALTLLPTVGALIGAPAKELWVVYKLMPLAGFLSMLLSLGGNIVPSETSDYTLKAKAFNYGGFVRTRRSDSGFHQVTYMDNEPHDDKNEARQFARNVWRRANNFQGSRQRGAIAFGITVQLFWIGVLIGVCIFLELGSVVVWWCQVSALLRV